MAFITNMLQQRGSRIAENDFWLQFASDSNRYAILHKISNIFINCYYSSHFFLLLLSLKVKNEKKPLKIIHDQTISKD